MFRSIDATTPVSATDFGGKAANLAAVAKQGYSIPPTVALSIALYQRYLQQTKIEAKLRLALGHKPLNGMRWEELWDLALRIRGLFLATELPAEMERALWQRLPLSWRQQPLVVRSSAPDEDGQSHSFAGLHESFVDVQGPQSISRAIRLVWASLWSDRALLYRRELGLSLHSAMGVLVQPLIAGTVSGVLFSRAPDDDRNLLIEAVYGLNQGLVDGQIEPYRWRINRRDGSVVEQTTPVDGPSKAPLTAQKRQQLRALAHELEQTFGQAQDIEWTFQQQHLTVLQARPITQADPDAERRWYLSLTPSLQRLQQLQQQIEKDLLPTMRQQARQLQAVALPPLSDVQLADHLQRCRATLEHWQQVYRDQLIPMAHGIRLFGQVYNDRLKPEDSFQFTRLLQGGRLLATRRNRLIQRIASLPAAKQQRARRRLHPYWAALGLNEALLEPLLRQKPDRFAPRYPNDPELEKAFKATFTTEEEPLFNQLLRVGRAAWRLRDDDNLYMEALRMPFRHAKAEVQRRLARQKGNTLKQLDLSLPTLSLPRQQAQISARSAAQPSSLWQQRARQLVGQPASPGVASGTARQILSADDCVDFKAGEILICDALDPTLTLVAPLAAAIVERRGGMLIHGAIIAREYGLPCVTGIPAATDVIQTGDHLTVDGHLGLVTIDTSRGD